MIKSFLIWIYRKFKNFADKSIETEIKYAKSLPMIRGNFTFKSYSIEGKEKVYEI